jgi:hypothetical protein
VNGDLLEAKTRSAELKDVRTDDFARFLEYAYRRDYTVPGWEKDFSAHAMSDDNLPMVCEPSASQQNVERVRTDQVIGGTQATSEAAVDLARQLAEEAVAEFECRTNNTWTEWTPGSKKAKAKIKVKRNNTTLRSKFQGRRYLEGHTPISDLEKGFQPKSNSSADQDFTPVFLAHARLYTFAEMRLIDQLKSLALHKLHKTLMDFKLYNQRVGDIVELARYAYDSGPDRSKAGDLDDLRQLVVEYIAYQVDIIGKHKAFRSLLEEGGEFVSDFWDIVTMYLL